MALRRGVQARSLGARIGHPNIGRSSASRSSEKDGIFQYGVPQFPFDMRANVFNTRNSYTPNRDGTRFLVNMLLDADDAPISIVQNWRATVQWYALIAGKQRPRPRRRR